MSARRRMLMAGGGGGGFSSPFAMVSAAGMELCRISGRLFKKAYDGEAFAAICFNYDGGKYWQFPALIALSSDACKRNPYLPSPVWTATVAGKTWYYCGSWYAKDNSPDSGFRNVGANPAALPIIYNPLSDSGVFPGDSDDAPAETAEILVKIHLGMLQAEVLQWEN